MVEEQERVFEARQAENGENDEEVAGLALTDRRTDTTLSDTNNTGIRDARTTQNCRCPTSELGAVTSMDPSHSDMLGVL